jgi:hypothetical protein
VDDVTGELVAVDRPIDDVINFGGGGNFSRPFVVLDGTPKMFSGNARFSNLYFWGKKQLFLFLKQLNRNSKIQF